MISLAYSTCKRSSSVIMGGCQESIREIASLPSIFYKAIFEIPHKIPHVSEIVKASPLFLITANPLSCKTRSLDGKC